MAIGARILSDNLSGKTASVTFNALSGGTFDLGNQTVPFNYINSYPYGTYDLYFAEYDYTYSITVPDPTPLEFILQSEFTPGSIVAKYTLTSNVFLNEEVTATFENILGVFEGSDINIFTGVTISKGSKIGETIVIIDNDFGNLDGNVSFSQISGLTSGSTYEVFNDTPNKQSMSFWTKQTGQTTYSTVNFAYGPLTAQTIDFGIESGDYFFYNFYPLTNRGYGYYFMKNDYSEMIVKFTDAYCNEVYSWSGTNSNLGWDDLDGVYATLVDRNNGTMHYCDGASGYTFTWDNITYPYLDIDWDYFAVTKDNSFIVRIYDDAETNYQSYLINKGTSKLLNTWNSDMNIWHEIYPYANYIIKHTYDNRASSYLTIDILELDGTTIRRTIDLSDYHYDAKNDSFWSENKFAWLLWDWSDTSLPFRIMSYDGESDTLDTHFFGSYDDYPNIVWKTDDKFSPNSNRTFDSLFLILYNSGGGEWFGYAMDKCEIFYMLSGQTTLTQYTYTNSSIKYLYPWSESGQNFVSPASTGGTDFQVFSITQNGPQFTYISEIGNGTAIGYNLYNIGNKFILGVWVNNTYQNYLIKIINENGEITDSLSATLTNPYNYAEMDARGIYYFTNNSNMSYWVNQSYDTFQQVTVYNWNYPDQYYSPDGLSLGVMGFQTQVAGHQYFRLVFRNGPISSEVEVPANNDSSYEFRIGRTNFLYVYNDLANGYFNWVLYDHSFNVLQQYSSTDTGLGWNVWAIKDRYVIQVNDGSAYTYYGIDNNGYQIQTSQNSAWWLSNDYINWD